MKNGLLPRAQLYDDPQLKAIFFWKYLQIAQNVCDPLSVILEVDIPKDCIHRGIWNEANHAFEYFVDDRIPPDALKVIEGKEDFRYF